MTDFPVAPLVGSEREMVLAFNNQQREALLWKLEGLSESQLREPHPVTGFSLLGLLKHLVRVEQIWFQGRVMGEPVAGEANDDTAWVPTADETFEVLSQQYRQAFGRSNAIAESLPLERAVAVTSATFGRVSLQWVLYHMIEETARHLGHADIIRQSIDGATGVNPVYRQAHPPNRHKENQAMNNDRNVDTVLSGDEKVLLLLFLNNQRETLLWKLEGLTDEQLRQQHPPSTLTLIGIVKHLTRVEGSWLQQDLLGPDVLILPQPVDEWGLDPDDTCADVIESYHRACAKSDEIVAALPLETVLADPQPLQAGVALRWAMVHMIEETARHLGQADLIRESIDGMVGQNPRYP